MAVPRIPRLARGNGCPPNAGSENPSVVPFWEFKRSDLNLPPNFGIAKALSFQLYNRLHSHSFGPSESQLSCCSFAHGLRYLAASWSSRWEHTTRSGLPEPSAHYIAKPRPFHGLQGFPPGSLKTITVRVEVFPPTADRVRYSEALSYGANSPSCFPNTIMAHLHHLSMPVGSTSTTSLLVMYLVGRI